MIRMSRGEKIFQVFLIFALIIFMFVMIYPLWYIAVASFSDNTAVMRSGGVMLWVKDFTPAAYNAVFKISTVWSGYANTLFVLIVGVTLNIFMTALGGYFLSRKNVYWGRFITLAIVFTMYFNGGLIPFYFTVRDMHLNDTLFALIIPTAISTYNMIIMRTAFAAVPVSLEESAKIDGARHLTILFRIMFPLCIPTVAVLILYYGVHHWNAWFHAMIFLRKREMFPLQLILREIVLYNTTMEDAAGAMDRQAIGETVQYAAIVVATLPILMIYPFVQRFFVKGVMIGAVKG